MNIENYALQFENYFEDIHENTKDIKYCEYKRYDNKLNFDSISKYYGNNEPNTWPTKLLAKKEFLEIISVVKNFDFQKSILYDHNQKRHQNKEYDIIYTQDINFDFGQNIKKGGCIIYNVKINSISDINTKYFKTVTVCKPILSKISDNRIFVVLTNYSPNNQNNTIVKIGSVLELYAEYVNTKSFIQLRDIFDLKKSFSVFMNIIKLNRQLNLKFHTKETEMIIKYSNIRNFHLLSKLYSVKDTRNLTTFRNEIERKYDYILSDKERTYLTAKEEDEEFNPLDFNYLQVKYEIETNGIQSLSDQILKYIKDNNIKFPTRKENIKLSNKSLDEVIMQMFNKIKDFEKCENSRWSHNKYYIQRAVFDRDYAITLPIKSSGEILKFNKPIYYLFDNFNSDYWNYNIITDYFIESSRIKSFIKTYNNDKYSPYLAWKESDDYKLRAIERVLLKEENFNFETLREALYQDKIVKEVSHEKVIFLSAFFRLILGDIKNPKIFDACAGWGDRYIASFLVNAECYIGVEPNNDSVKPFKRMNEILNSDNPNFMVLHDYMPSARLPDYVTNNYFDLCFLSPPSFDSENYGQSEGQSVLMFPKREQWKQSFLVKTINRCWDLLNNGGYFVVQSIIIQEIMPIIEKNKNAIYLGSVSVTGEKGRVKPLWIWLKYDGLINKTNLQIISNPNINIITDQFSPLINGINVFSWKNFQNYSNEYYLLYKPTDYFYNTGLFIKSIEKIKNLYNPIKTIKWNIYKYYLRELGKNGVNIIPTTISNYINPNEFKTDKIIIKPISGGGSNNVYQFDTPKNDNECIAIENFLFTKSDKVKFPYRKGQDFIIQPYFHHKEEYSLIYYFDGFSHAVVKTKINENEISSFKNRKVEKFVPEKNLIDLGYQTLDKARQVYLFARLDFIFYNNKYYLIELEFIDPNLFYDTDAEQMHIMVEKLKKYIEG